MTQDRFRTKIPAQFKAGHVSGKGDVRNVSDGGLFVGTLAIPEEGSEVELTMCEPGKTEIVVHGLVWWTARVGQSKRCGFGLRLLDEQEDFQRLVDSVR